jgi:hypothetical protein
VPTRIFLWFDYDSTGLWYSDGERPAGTVDPDDVGLSDSTKQRLAVWLQRCDDTNMQAIRKGRGNRRASARAQRETLALWRVIRDEAGPDWIVGIRDERGVAWDEADLAS